MHLPVDVLLNFYTFSSIHSDEFFLKNLRILTTLVILGPPGHVTRLFFLGKKFHVLADLFFCFRRISIVVFFQEYFGTEQLHAESQSLRFSEGLFLSGR